MAPGSRGAREAELEAEEEEEEDDAELGDEVGHLRGLDQRQLLGLVRSEQEAREQICRNRGEAETPRHQAERPEHSDGDGELGESHARILPVGCDERPHARPWGPDMRGPTTAEERAGSARVPTRHRAGRGDSSAR